MRLRYFAVSLLCLAAANAGAQAGKKEHAGKSPELRIDYTKETLPNGLTVVYHVDHSTPVAAVLLWYNVGSKMEQPGKTGFAHLFEHMMFKGSKNVADGQHLALLEAAGGRAGADINGTTSWDRTNYFEQLPSNQLELALWLESDRMGTLTDDADAGEARQPARSREERAPPERRQPAVRNLAREKTGEALFPDGHPYHHSVIGSMTDLSNASVADVRSFFKTYYAPNNAVLVVAGDIDVPAGEGNGSKLFRTNSAGPPTTSRQHESARNRRVREQRIVVQDAQAPAPADIRGVPRSARKRPPRARCAPLADVIGGGRSSRLYDALVRRQQVATKRRRFQFRSRRRCGHARLHRNRKGGKQSRLSRASLARGAGGNFELHAV